MSPFRHPRSILALAVSLLLSGCTPSEVGTVGPADDSAATRGDASAPLVKGGKEQPAVKVRGKSVSAREAAGIGR
jgi:hypothetical protein